MYRFGIILAIVLIGCLLTFSIAKEDDSKSRTIIGIDLGTSYSCVGVYKNGQVEIIANDQGNRLTPSWVAFTDSETLIGEAAKNQAVVNAERTIFDIKRFIGRKFDDKEVQRDMKLVPYKIVNNEGRPYIQVKIKDGETKVFSPEEITAMILSKMKETAEAFLGKKITDAVITVPAYFNDAQRQATKDAGSIAGLNVARILNEPLAVGIAYDLHNEATSKNILVFDLGHEAFDVTVTEIDYGVFENLATNGDPHLGGEDFNQRIMEHFIELIKNKYGKDISNDKIALGKLQSEVERATRDLNSQHLVHVEIKSLFDSIDFSEPLSRAQFEELNEDLFKKTMEPVKKALQDAGLQKHQIKEIILVGGSSKIPKVQQLLKDFFDGKEPNKSVNPDEAVAIGAAVLGDIYTKLHRGCVFTNVDARDDLKTYTYDMINLINDKRMLLADMLKWDEKEKIKTATKEVLEWLDDSDNGLVEIEEYDEKRKNLSKVCSPIIADAYRREREDRDAQNNHGGMWNRFWARIKTVGLKLVCNQFVETGLKLSRITDLCAPGGAAKDEDDGHYE